LFFFFNDTATTEIYTLSLHDALPISAFDRRAERYEQGWLGHLHRELVDRTADIALSSQPHPSRVLDVGCGTGYMLRVLAGRCPGAVELAGVDPASSMIEMARTSTADPRVVVEVGCAEHLPYPDACFDLVVSTTSFDHWADQRAGLAECARVLVPGGSLVVADLFSPLLIPTLVGARREKARTKARANRLLRSVGLDVAGWHRVYALISAVSAAK